MTRLSTERGHFIAYPTNRVVGTVADADKAREAVAALRKAGFDQEDIEVLHGEEDLKRLDPTGTEHGFLAHFQRTLIRTFELEEFKQLTHHVNDVRAGRSVIMVKTKRRGQRLVAADILHHYGAEFVGFYGRWAWEELHATAPKSPGDVPAFFARAWNERDANALASLFDEDAEFVNVGGICFHDRESIRQAHAQGLERIVSQSIMAIDEVKVKLLSPDVAVVHARMTLSGEAPAAAMTGAAPQTTIVTFVVHRGADRWLCAAAHKTDVIPAAEPNVVDGAAGVA